MPLPSPHKDESHDDFMARCLSDDALEEFESDDQKVAVCESQWEQEHEGAKAMDFKYPRILEAITTTPWAILPETLQMICGIFTAAASGRGLTAEEIQARIGAAQRPSARRSGAVAVLPLHGPIAQRMNMMVAVSGGTSTEMFAKQFRAVMSEPGIGSVIIEVDSPGGTISGVEELATEIFKARGTKPIIAQVNSMMASAAFWIGAAADEIVITPGGEIGSVGVYGMHMDFSEADAKAGVKTTLISAGKFKTEGNQFEPLSDEARGAFQQRIDEVYGMFVASLARSRGVSAATVRHGFGEGRMVGAKAALELGMADRIGTMQDTLKRLGVGATGGQMAALSLGPELMADAGDAPEPEAVAKPAGRDIRERRLRLLEKA